jgi:hypothetical protein
LAEQGPDDKEEGGTISCSCIGFDPAAVLLSIRISESFTNPGGEYKNMGAENMGTQCSFPFSDNPGKLENEYGAPETGGQKCATAA